MNRAMDHPLRDRAFTAGAGAAAVGAIVIVVGAVVAPARAAASYLTAYAALLTVIVGALILIMSAHLSGAVWFIPFRRHAVALVSALPALAVLMVPMLIAPASFWPWARPVDTLPETLQAAVAGRQTYFHPAFFLVRAVLYWAAWLGVGETLRRSIRGERSRPSRRVSVVSALGTPLVGLALSFAAFDWMMSVSPDWSSSVFGAYVFAGAMVTALATLAALSFSSPRRFAALPATAEHLQALGRLTLAFVLFWAYLWYAQFFIIWIGDIPGEVTWYVVRLGGLWKACAITIVIVGFVVPFLVLVVRAARGSGPVMASVGLLLIGVHYLDIYWLVVPSLRPQWSGGDLLWDLAGIALVAGTAIACARWRQLQAPALPVDRALFTLSMQYQAH
jgi:hypothetical protein